MSLQDLYETLNESIPFFPVVLGILILIIITGIAFLFLGGESNTTLVTIEVSNQVGVPLRGIDLEISGLDSILKLKTDKNGRASFEAELDKEIEITASKEDYEEKTRNVTVTKELIINLKLSKPLFDSKEVTITFVGPDNKKLIGKKLEITLGCTGSGVFEPSEYTTNSGELTVEPPLGCGTITYTINGSGFETSRGSILGKEQLIELQTIKTPKGSVEITVKDGQNNRFLDGINVKLVEESGLVTGFQGYTSFGEISFENVEIGNYTAITEDPELEYGNKSITIGVNPDQRTRKDIMITKDLQLTATIEVTDKRDRIPVQGATIAIYDPGGFIVGEQKTNSSGKANFALLERGLYIYIVSKENYLPMDSGSFDTDDYPKASEQNFEVDLEKCTPTTCGALVVRVIDDEHLVVENAKVMILDADGFIQTSFGSKITDYNGNTTPFLNLDPEKVYKVLVQKYPAEGISPEVTVEPLKENFFEVVLEIGTGTVSITVKDKLSTPIDFAEAELFTDYGESLGIISVDSEGTGFLENLKADKKVYAVISKEGYSSYTTTAQQVVKDKFIFFNAILEEEISGDKPTIELDGIYNNTGAWVSQLAPGKRYEARFLLTVPRSFDETGVFFRTGEKEHIEQDNIYITKVNVPGTSQIKGKDYKPPNGNTIITNGNAKWVSVVWDEPKEGKYEIAFEFETDKGITPGTFLPVYYRSWGENGSKYLRDPLDSELGEAEETNEKTALYAESYEKPLFEGLDSICYENFCFGHRLLNETTGIYEQEPYNLKSFSPYSLEFSITNNTEVIHDNAELSIKSTQDGVSVSEDLVINSYSFTDADSREVSSETPTFEIASLSLGNFRFNKTISGLLSIEPKSEFSSSLEFDIISNQNEIMNNQVLFNTFGNEEIDIIIEPEEIGAFVPTNLKIIVTQATGELEGFGVQDALIVVKKIAPDQSEQMFTGTTNKEGISEISIPASSPGTKIFIKAEKPGLNPKTIEIEINNEIVKFDPEEINHSVTRNAEEQDITFISIENLIGETIYINKLRASGSFFGLLDEARMDNFLAGFVGTTIEGQGSSGIEYLSVFGEEAKFLEESQVVEGSIVIEFMSNFDASTSWVYEIPTKTKINLGALPENDSCLIISINKWEDSTITGQSTIEFDLINNCINNNGELLNIDRLVSTIDWEGDEGIIGNVELTLLNPTTGESISEVLQPTLWSNLLSNVEPEVTYIGRLNFVSKSNTIGKKAKFTVNIDGQIKTNSGWQFIGANNSIDSEILIVHLNECIKSDYGFGGEQMLELGQEDTGTFTLDSSSCGKLPIEVRLCHEDTGCKGGSTEGGITVNPRNFTLKSGNSTQEITVARENIPGIYGIKVEVKPEGGSWRRIGEVLITLDPAGTGGGFTNPYAGTGGGYSAGLFSGAGGYTNNGEPFTLSRYNFDLIGTGAKDTATLTNRFLSETVTVEASATDWGNAFDKSNDDDDSSFDIGNAGLGAAVGGLLGAKPALDAAKGSASEASKEAGEAMSKSKEEAQLAAEQAEQSVEDTQAVADKAQELKEGQETLEKTTEVADKAINTTVKASAATVEGACDNSNANSTASAAATASDTLSDATGDATEEVDAVVEETDNGVQTAKEGSEQLSASATSVDTSAQQAAPTGGGKLGCGEDAKGSLGTATEQGNKGISTVSNLANILTGGLPKLISKVGESLKNVGKKQAETKTKTVLTKTAIASSSSDTVYGEAACAAAQGSAEGAVEGVETTEVAEVAKKTEETEKLNRTVGTAAGTAGDTANATTDQGTNAVNSINDEDTGAIAKCDNLDSAAAATEAANGFKWGTFGGVLGSYMGLGFLGGGLAGGLFGDDDDDDEEGGNMRDNTVTEDLQDWVINLSEDSMPIDSGHPGLKANWNTEDMKSIGQFAQQTAGIIFENTALEEEEKYVYSTVNFKATKHIHADPTKVMGGLAFFGQFNVPDSSTQSINQKFHLRFKTGEEQRQLTNTEFDAQSCDVGNRIGYTGPEMKPRIKLNWDWADFKEYICDESNPDYVYCDAVQFNMETNYKINALREFIEVNHDILSCPVNPAQVILDELTAELANLGFYEAPAPSLECWMPRTTTLIEGRPALDFYVEENLSRIRWLPEYGINNRQDLMDLITFNTYLIQDGYSEDMLSDFENFNNTKKFFQAPEFFNRLRLKNSGETYGIDEYYRQGKIKFYKRYDETAVKLSSPGKYRAHIKIDFDEGWGFFDSNDNLLADIKIELSLIDEPKIDNALYRVPFDGLVGIEDGEIYDRQGYGTVYENDGELLNIDNSTTPAISYPGEGSNPVANASVKISRDLYSLNASPSTRGMILEINNPTGIRKNINFQPAHATPVIMEVGQNNKTDEPFSAVYEIIENDVPLNIGTSSTFWDGAGNCYDFTGEPAAQSFYEKPDRATVGKDDLLDWENKYAVDWPNANITGNTYLRTIYYSDPLKETILSSVKSPDGLKFYSADESGSKVRLDGVSSMPYNSNIGGTAGSIGSISEIFDLVDAGMVCVTNSSNSTKFWWNPKVIYDSQGSQRNISDMTNNLEAGSTCIG
ncbi:MAG: hypothetical protein ABIH20_00705 [Candidatus Diapherotrites archaeon]